MELHEDARASTSAHAGAPAAGDGDRAPDRAEVARVIGAVQGVAAAAARRDATTGRTRLRLQLRPGADREQVAWKVSAVLRERFGIALDPAAIQPVVTTPARQQPPPPPTPVAVPPPPPEPSAPPVGLPAHARPDAAASRHRVAIGRLDLRRDARSCRATVVLEGPAGSAEGVVGRVLTTQDTLRAVAEATVLALAQLTEPRLEAGVDGVEHDARGVAPRVIVAVSVLGAWGEEPLLGVAVVRDDVERAVVRATLDALNRRIAPLLTAVGAAGSHR